MSDRWMVGFVVLVVAVLMGVYLVQGGSLNAPAPGFSLPNGYGGRIDLESYRGRPVLLVFWAPWCGICQHELPLLNRLEAEFDSQGIAVVAINVGGQSDADAYFRSNHISLTSLADSEGTVARAYDVSGIPKLVLIGKDGRVKRSASGWTDESILRHWIDAVGGH